MLLGRKRQVVLTSFKTETFSQNNMYIEIRILSGTVATNLLCFAVLYDSGKGV